VKFNFVKESRGIGVIETALTLPVVCYLIFFILEAIKVNDLKTALDSIAEEAIFDFIISKNTNNFAAIIRKYKPAYIPDANVAYYFDIYPDLATMCGTSPYGGEEIFWPNVNGVNTTKTYNDDNYISTTGGAFIARPTSAAISLTLTNYKKPESDFDISKTNANFKTLSGKAVVLTVVCDYVFSSAMVKILFSGGSNTKGKKKFLLWARGVGVCS
jgi:hypothetical protein